GSGPDELCRRAERAAGRAARLRSGVAGVIALLIVSGGFFAWRAHETGQTLAERQATPAEIEALVAKYTPAGGDQAPGAGAGLTAAITAIANSAEADARYAPALALRKAGNPP